MIITLIIALYLLLFSLGHSLAFALNILLSVHKIDVSGCGILGKIDYLDKLSLSIKAEGWQTISSTSYWANIRFAGF